MRYLQRLEPGDKIFIIDDDNQIKTITLDGKHLIEDRRDRSKIYGQYKIKSDEVECGKDVQLIKFTRHEELDDDDVKRFYFECEDADKVAYLSFDDAQSHLNDMIYQKSVIIELQEDANRELESHLAAAKSVLSNYFDRIDRHDIDNALLKDNEEHKRLLKLRESIS